MHRPEVPLLQLPEQMSRRRRPSDDRNNCPIEFPRLGSVHQADLHSVRAAIVRHARIDEVVPNVRIRHGSETDLPFKKRDVAVQGETLDRLADLKI